MLLLAFVVPPWKRLTGRRRKANNPSGFPLPVAVGHPRVMLMRLRFANPMEKRLLRMRRLRAGTSMTFTVAEPLARLIFAE
jgi:hypothetical protein